MPPACSSARRATRPTTRASDVIFRRGPQNWKDKPVAVAEFKTPRLKEYPVIPILQAGAMAHSRPFVAAAPIQKALGFPGELVENWQEKAIARMGERLGKYRSQIGRAHV